MERYILKFFIFLLIAIFGILGIFRLWDSAFKKEKRITLYFSDKHGVFLVPVSRKVYYSPSIADIAKEWARGPADKDNLLGLIPPEVTLVNIVKFNDHQIITLSDNIKKYLEEDLSLRDLFFMALFNTLTPYASLQQIQVKASGDEKAMTDGEGGNEYLINDLNLNEGETDPGLLLAGDKERISLYFLSKGTRYLVPIIREIAKGTNKLKEIADEEIKGPFLNDVLESPFPSGVGIKEIKQEGELVSVDFSGGILSFVKKEPVKGRLAALAMVLALTEIKEVKKIRFFDNGRLFGPEVKWPHIWERPKNYNLEEKFG